MIAWRGLEKATQTPCPGVLQLLGDDCRRTEKTIYYTHLRALIDTRKCSQRKTRCGGEMRDSRAREEWAGTVYRPSHVATPVTPGRWMTDHYFIPRACRRAGNRCGFGAATSVADEALADEFNCLGRSATQSPGLQD